MLNKRERRVASVREQQTKYFKKSHKFSIELHEIVKPSLALDARNGSTLLEGELSKEFENIRKTFKILPDWNNSSFGHQFMQCYMVFYIKMEDLRWCHLLLHMPV